MPNRLNYPSSNTAKALFTQLQKLGLHPTQEYPLPPGRRGWIDIAFPDIRWAIEVDGQHHLKPEQKEKDKEKDTHLKSAGWSVERYPANKVFGDLIGTAAEIKEKYDKRAEFGNVALYVEQERNARARAEEDREQTKTPKG